MNIDISHATPEEEKLIKEHNLKQGLKYPKKVTIELTVEQARCVEYALYEVKPASYKDLTAQEKKDEAFIRRILDKLAKAKTSAT